MSAVRKSTYVEKLAERVLRCIGHPEGQDARMLLEEALKQVPPTAAALAHELESRPCLEISRDRLGPARPQSVFRYSSSPRFCSGVSSVP